MSGQIRQLELSAAEKQALKARYQETNNRRWQERIQCVLLKHQGLTLEAISEVLPYSVNRISHWIRTYVAEGLDGICVWGYRGRPRRLSEEQQQALRTHVAHTAYRRVKDVVVWVESQWGITYSEDGMREMLHNLGFSYQKGQIVPGKVDTQAQALFFEGDF
jgi:transposase